MALNVQPGAGGLGPQGAAGWGVSQTRKHALLRVRNLSGPTPSVPTNLDPGASFVGGVGAVLGHREIQMLPSPSQSLDTPPHQASPSTLPTADTSEKLTLGGQEGGIGGNGTDWEAAMSLLTCFFKELTPLE